MVPGGPEIDKGRPLVQGLHRTLPASMPPGRRVRPGQAARSTALLAITTKERRGPKIARVGASCPMLPRPRPAEEAGRPVALMLGLEEGASHRGARPRCTNMTVQESCPVKAFKSVLGAGEAGGLCTG